MSKFVCKKCGSDHIDMLAWVNVNTREYQEDSGVGEYYCLICDDHVEIKEIEIDEENISTNNSGLN